MEIWLREIVYMETQMDQEYNIDVPMLFIKQWAIYEMIK